MKYNSSDAIFAYLESFTNLEKAPNLTAREYRLDRMRALLPLFGNPERAFKAVHIAGSKGKGSTSAFAASMLTAAGFRTGLYCSPHVTSYKERISLSGAFFPEDVYVKTGNIMLERLEGLDFGIQGGPPTTFELLTLLAFLVFREQGCEWAVFETGLGGRLDATNVLQPEAVILTRIEREHTEYLGDTIALIASEKAGIMKPGVPVFCADQSPDAEQVFRSRAEELGCPIVFLGEVLESAESLPAEGHACSCGKAAEDSSAVQVYPGILRWKNGNTNKILPGMGGSYQLSNAALALLCLETLSRQKSGLVIPNGSPSSEVFAAGLPHAFLPGRMEGFTYKGLPVVIDGAHTPVSVRLSAEAFLEKNGKGTLIFGSVSGKDTEGMAEVLCGLFENIIISTPGSFKPNKPEDVFAVFSAVSSGARLIKEPEAALSEACAAGLPVFAAGSFYMAAEIRKILIS